MFCKRCIVATPPSRILDLSQAFNTQSISPDVDELCASSNIFPVSRTLSLIMLNIGYCTWSPPQLIQVCFVRFLKASCHVSHPSYCPGLWKCELEVITYEYPLQMVSDYITLAFFGFLDSWPPSSKVSRFSKSIASRSCWRVLSNSLSHLPPSAPSNNHT